MASETFSLPAGLRRHLEHAGLEFLAEFHGRATRRHPENVEALAELATALTLLGRLEEGLAADERLVELVPTNATVRYNLACSLALLGHKDAALDALERALELGYSDAPHLAADEDLLSLHDEERFRALLARLGASAKDDE